MEVRLTVILVSVRWVLMKRGSPVARVMTRMRRSQEEGESGWRVRSRMEGTATAQQQEEEEVDQRREREGKGVTE